MPANLYRLVCVIDSSQELSSIDCSSGYLHIHILESSRLKSIDELKTIKPSELGKKRILYQWGMPFEKESHTRTEKVSAAEIKKFGQVGIGSAARGSEKEGNFLGGGEGFLFASESFRITKGDEIFTSGDDQKYWTFQVADFSECEAISDFKDKKINGRQDLQHLLESKCDGACVATFDVEFEGQFVARSNGIFPEDRVSSPTRSVFIESVKGGHLLGGSDAYGDLESLSSAPSSSQLPSNFTFVIKSDVLLQPLQELQIAKPDGSFRKPRTEAQFAKAVQVIEALKTNNSKTK